MSGSGTPKTSDGPAVASKKPRKQPANAGCGAATCSVVPYAELQQAYANKGEEIGLIHAKAIQWDGKEVLVARMDDHDDGPGLWFRIRSTLPDNRTCELRFALSDDASMALLRLLAIQLRPPNVKRTCADD